MFDSSSSRGAFDHDVVPEPRSTDVQRTASKAKVGVSGPAEPVPHAAPASVYEVVTDLGVHAFQDQFGQARIWIPVAAPEPHFECHLLKSKTCLALLLALVRRQPGRDASLPELRACVEQLELDAITQEMPVENRIAERDDHQLIDLGDPNWRMIEVSESDWKIVEHDKPIFARTVHQRALPDPVQGGSVEPLFDFLGIEDDDKRLLVLTTQTFHESSVS